jgi:DNA-binding CsgD family transcriptional regulator
MDWLERTQLPVAMTWRRDTPLNEEDYSDRLERLSARKGDCLREAAKGLSSKEIGRALNLSPHTVNNHILETRQILGNVSRWKAAQLFVDWEAGRGGQIIPPYPMTIPSGANSGSTASTETKADAQPEQEELEDLFAEGQRLYSVSEHPSSLLDIVPLRAAGRQRNDLNGPSTLIVFAILTTMMLFAVGAGISLLLVLNDLVAK